MDTQNKQDLLFSFIFDQRPIRGVTVKLDQVISTILAQRAYPLAIQNLLSEALVAVVLLFNLSKERGKMTLQFQSDENKNSNQDLNKSKNGLIKLLSVQCTYDLKLRALAQWDNPNDGDLNHELSFLELMGASGKLVMTYQSETSQERFQSIIPLAGDSLSDSMQAYFCQSEQLKTYLKISTKNSKAAGMLLQLMPSLDVVSPLDFPPQVGEGPDSQKDHFSHVTALASTLTDQELLEDSPERLLHKLFHQDPVRVFEPRGLYFGCTCSLDRMKNAIFLMGKAESLKILDGPDAKDSIEIKCEFCQNSYAFSRTEVEQLFE